MAEVVGAGEGLWYRNLLSYISLQPRCCCTTPHLNNFVNVHFLFCILLCMHSSSRMGMKIICFHTFLF